MTRDADAPSAVAAYPKGAPPRRHWVALVLLSLILVVAIVAAVDLRNPGVVLLFGPIIVAGMVGLLTRRALGYGVAVSASALFALFGAVVVLADPDVGSFVLCTILALPLPFLISPASWRWLRAQRAAEAAARTSAGGSLPRPAGWTSDQAGGGCMLALLLGVGAFLLVSAVGVTLDHRGEPGAIPLGVAMASLGAMILAATPLFSSRRGGKVRLVDRRTTTGRQPCLRFPASRLRVAGSLAVFAFLLLSGAGFLTVAPVAVGLGANPWPVAVFGTLFAGIGAAALAVKVVQLRHGIDTDLTPMEVRTARSAPVPWERIAVVKAGEDVSYSRGVQIVSPFIRVVLKAEASQQRRYRVPYGRRLLGADLRISMRTLSVEPRLLYHALRWYHSNPDVRAELADERSVDRIQRCDLKSSTL